MRKTNNLNPPTVSVKEVTEEESNNESKRNVGGNKIVSSRGYILRGEIERLAVKKYKECGRGIQHSDVMEEFLCSKAKAQRILKYSCTKSGMIMKGGQVIRHDPI